MAIHVMLDLETLGTMPNSVIASIGAVRFDPDGEVTQPLNDTFYCTIDAKDSVNHGLQIEQSTLDWWKLQGPDALKELRKNNVLLKSALSGFAEWFGANKQSIWANSPAFDCVILESSYRALGLEKPWLPWNELCYRTMKNVFKAKPPKREGIHHNALDDAIYQTRHLLSIFKS